MYQPARAMTDTLAGGGSKAPAQDGPRFSVPGFSVPAKLLPVTIGPEQAVAHRGWCEARDQLLAASLAGPGVTLVLGPAGTGKTLLLQQLAHALTDRGMDVVLQPRGDLPIEDAWLAEAAQSNPRRVVLIDEADRMTEASLGQLERLGLCPVILAGVSDPGEGRSDRDAGITRTIRLAPLPEDEVRAFIAARLHQAGLSPDLIGAGAVARLAAHSGGVPRILNMLVGAALFLANTEQAPRIEAAHVDEAAALRDGNAEAAAPAPPPDPVTPDEVPVEAPPVETAAVEVAAVEPPPLVVAPSPVAPRARLAVMSADPALSRPRARTRGSRRRATLYALAGLAAAFAGAILWRDVSLRHPAPEVAREMARERASVPAAPGAAAQRPARPPLVTAAASPKAPVAAPPSPLPAAPPHLSARHPVARPAMPRIGQANPHVTAAAPEPAANRDAALAGRLAPPAHPAPSPSPAARPARMPVLSARHSSQPSGIGSDRIGSAVPHAVAASEPPVRAERRAPRGERALGFEARHEPIPAWRNEAGQQTRFAPSAPPEKTLDLGDAGPGMQPGVPAPGAAPEHKPFEVSAGRPAPRYVGVYVTRPDGTRVFEAGP